MKKLSLAVLFSLFAMLATPLVYAEDLPEISGDESSEPLPPLTDGSE